MTRFLIACFALLLISCHKESIEPMPPAVAPPSDTIPLVSDTIPLGPDDPIDPPADTTIRITPCSLWQGHVVALVDTLSGSTIELTLVSLVDYDKIYSAISTSANFDTLVHNYQEYDESIYTNHHRTQVEHNLNYLRRKLERMQSPPGILKEVTLS